MTLARLTSLVPRLPVALALSLPPTALAQQPTDTIALTAGLVITSSATVRPAVYRLQAAGPDSAVIVIRGSNISVDFSGATLQGIDSLADPDQATGIGVLIDGGANITLTGAHIRGYKFGVLARDTRNLTIAGGDFSHNWKPRLFSRIEHESLVDWLSHHHNESGEWQRFGAGVYLEGVRGGLIARNSIEQGMEGLMLTRSDSLTIRDNTIQFNSGVGIGLYRSSWNAIVSNAASFNVRGYSHGFFHRGQDSANLLLFEQSSHNFVAWNAMTHGGDGLFLWAGQHTMDTGEGGSNDNTFLKNDFSYAPTNAMEATFSRNRFIGNRAAGSDHGLWGGYSFDSEIVGNDFADNRVGIAIEHGQDNRIVGNMFDENAVGIQLWANPIEPSDWGYPKHRDTRSRGTRIMANTFIGGRVGIRASGSSDIGIADNRFHAVDSVLVLNDHDSFHISAVDSLASPAPARPTPDRRDRSAIIVDEWGPYDWRSPKLWPGDSANRTPLPLRVLGPAGTWRLLSSEGATLSDSAGATGDTIMVYPEGGRNTNWHVTLEYTGAATISARGEARAAGAPIRFSYRRFQPIERWDVTLFHWQDGENPLASDRAFRRLLQQPPAAVIHPASLDIMGYLPQVAGMKLERTALVAVADITLPPGEFTLRTISDDAMRVWVDGRRVIDRWRPHESEVHSVPIGAGRHKLRVEYAQVSGWAELSVEIVEGVQRSEGSPGPH